MSTTVTATVTTQSTIEWLWETVVRSGPHTWVTDTRTPFLTFSVLDERYTSGGGGGGGGGGGNGALSWWSLPSAISTLSVSTTATCNVAATIATNTYGIYIPHIGFWIHVLTGMLLACCLAIPTAMVVYYAIVRPQQQISRRRRTGTTVLGYVLGWTILLPLWIFAPSIMLERCHVPNLVVRFAVSVATPTICIFRTLESLYGFTPMLTTTSSSTTTTSTTPSLGAFVFYFCCPMRLQYQQVDKYTKIRPGQLVTTAPDGSLVYATGTIVSTITTTVPVSWSKVRRQLGHYVKYLFLTGAYMSILQELHQRHLDDKVNNDADTYSLLYALGPSSIPRSDFYHVSSLYNPHQWRENIVFAILMQLVLSLFAEGIALAVMVLTRCDTAIFADNPLFGSSSPSDFWGRRWNRCIQDCLKNGVYKPVRIVGGGSAGLAVLATFLASALFHEWLLPSVFYTMPNTHGITTAFFLWQALLILLERLLVQAAITPSKQALPGRRPGAVAIPAIAQSALVVFVGLPPAHWFMDSYVRSDFFAHAHMLLPMVLRVDGSKNTCGGN